MKNVIATLLAATFALLAGCNTMQGIGQDVKKAGGALEEAAAKKK